MAAPSVFFLSYYLKVKRKSNLGPMLQNGAKLLWQDCALRRKILMIQKGE
jgi:hypothetical protein